MNGIHGRQGEKGIDAYPVSMAEHFRGDVWEMTHYCQFDIG